MMQNIAVWCYNLREWFRICLIGYCVVNNRKLAKMEKKSPARAVAALNAANQRALTSVCLASS